MNSLKFFSLVLVLVALTGSINAQKYLTKNGNIRFYSDTPMEKIEAINKQVNAAIDLSTNQIVFKVLMKSLNSKRL